mmetsp:Transcript_21752/g.43621  ORF Transcript_21752/g.43621 Transcript_21752/m.43621 type:complete len:103 (+) Transcript_21752:977-1285(+)
MHCLNNVTSNFSAEWLVISSTRMKHRMWIMRIRIHYARAEELIYLTYRQKMNRLITEGDRIGLWTGTKMANRFDQDWVEVEQTEIERNKQDHSEEMDPSAHM